MRKFEAFPKYVPVADRKKKADEEIKRLTKTGHKTSPVVIEGRNIASTFWGKAWCENLERYSDLESRLPKGRSYVRGGAVCDLQIEPGNVRALVSGTAMYKVAIQISPVSEPHWTALCKECSGSIGSLVELLQGQLSKHVMQRICKEKTGLFPEPKEINFTCSCPDGALMCKHIAAVLYGIGARLDHAPNLLFLLRKVNEKDLITKASAELPTAPIASNKRILHDNLSEVFGLEIVTPTQFAPPAKRAKSTKGG